MKYISAILLIIIGLVGGLISGYILNDVREFHHSTPKNKDFFENIFKALPLREINKEKVKGVLVNHHLLAPRFIADALLGVSNKDVKTIFLISPNHFFKGRGDITTSLFDWETPYGILKTDEKVIKKLAEKSLVEIDPSPFNNEHGVSNLTAFIKKAV